MHSLFKYQNLNNLKFYFVILVIPFLISGPFIPDLIVSLYSFLFLIHVFRKSLFFYFKKKPVFFFFIFCLYCILLSIFIAENIFFSLKSSFFYFRIGIFACLIWYLIEQKIKLLNYFYFILVLTFSFLVVDGYIQYFTGFNLLGFPINGIRVSSFFGDELIMGSYISRLYFLTFALFLLRLSSKFEFCLICILFCLSSGLIFISGERAALFLHFLSMLFVLVLTKRFLKMKFFIFMTSLILILFLSFTNNSLKERVFKKPIDKMNLSKKYEQKYIFTPAHDSLIRTAYNMFLDKPIFGHGPKMFRIKCKNKKYATGKTPCMTHPHNFYVQLLAETGIIGFMFLFSALVYVIYCALWQLKTIVLKKHGYLTDYQICLLACLLITVWPLTTNGNFFNNWLSITYSLPVGFYLHSIYGKNKDKLLEK